MVLRETTPEFNAPSLTATAPLEADPPPVATASDGTPQPAGCSLPFVPGRTEVHVLFYLWLLILAGVAVLATATGQPSVALGALGIACSHLRRVFDPAVRRSR